MVNCKKKIVLLPFKKTQLTINFFPINFTAYGQKA